MRLLVLSATAAALATTILALSAEAASARHYRHYVPGGYGARPYWQGTPMDRLPIWRYGYYQGNDPDNFIRSQLMRDPKTPNK
jgi:hypothetical protein